MKIQYNFKMILAYLCVDVFDDDFEMSGTEYVVVVLQCCLIWLHSWGFRLSITMWKEIHLESNCNHDI